MIQYTLKCDRDHVSESWFQSASAYDALEKGGHLSCVICGSTAITKALMAPRVRPSEDAAQPAPKDRQQPDLAALRRKVEETSDYVGDNFAAEARAMHLGDAAERSIYGEARPDQAKALLDDGVPVMPLPFRPKRKLS